MGFRTVVPGGVGEGVGLVRVGRAEHVSKLRLLLLLRHEAGGAVGLLRLDRARGLDEAGEASNHLELSGVRLDDPRGPLSPHLRDAGGKTQTCK